MLETSFKGVFLCFIFSISCWWGNTACINHLKWKLPPESSLEAGVSNFISKIDGIETHPCELWPIWHPLFKDPGKRRGYPATRRRPPLSVCKPAQCARGLESSREAWEHNPPSQEADPPCRRDNVPLSVRPQCSAWPHSPQKAMSVTTTSSTKASSPFMYFQLSMKY